MLTFTLISIFWGLGSLSTDIHNFLHITRSLVREITLKAISQKLKKMWAKTAWLYRFDKSYGKLFPKFPSTNPRKKPDSFSYFPLKSLKKRHDEIFSLIFKEKTKQPTWKSLRGKFSHLIEIILFCLNITFHCPTDNKKK